MPNSNQIFFFGVFMNVPGDLDLAHSYLWFIFHGSIYRGHPVGAKGLIFCPPFPTETGRETT